MRDAFTRTLTDPELLAEAKKRRLEIDPISGEDLEALAKEMVSTPRDVIERTMGKLLGK